ncbi:MAG: hypothetical protein ACOYK9_06840, partial [Chlamydiia bacterium]
KLDDLCAYLVILKALEMGKVEVVEILKDKLDGYSAYEVIIKALEMGKVEVLGILKDKVNADGYVSISRSMSLQELKDEKYYFLHSLNTYIYNSHPSSLDDASVCLSDHFLNRLSKPESITLQGSGAILLILMSCIKLQLPDELNKETLTRAIRNCCAKLSIDERRVANAVFEFYKSSQGTPFVMEGKIEQLRPVSADDLMNLIGSPAMEGATCTRSSANSVLKNPVNGDFMIIYKGANHHSTYLQVIKGVDGGYFALHHDLWGRTEVSQDLEKRGNIYPDPLYFKDISELEQFTKFNGVNSTISHLSFYRNVFLKNQHRLLKYPELIKGMGPNDRAIAEKWTTFGGYIGNEMYQKIISKQDEILRRAQDPAALIR